MESQTQFEEVYAGLGPAVTDMVNVAEIHYHQLWTKWRLDKVSAPTIFRALGPNCDLAIGATGVLITGHDIYEDAKRRGLKQLSCLRFKEDDNQVLMWAIRACHPHSHLNEFIRVALAIDLFGERLHFEALENCRAGGKGAANLPYPAARFRKRISEIAFAKERNVDKIHRIYKNSPGEVIDALRDNKISIDRAYKWSSLSSKDQQANLEKYLAGRERRSPLAHETKKFEQKLLILERQGAGTLDACELGRALSKYSNGEVSIRIEESEDRFMVVSAGLLKSLGIHQPKLF